MTRYLRPFTSIAFLLIFALAGCAVEPDLTIKQPEDYKFAQNREDVYVAIEPWTDQEALKALLGKKVGEDILAVRVIIFNRSDQRIHFSSTQAKLVLPDESELSPIPISELSQRHDVDGDAIGAVIYIATGGYGAGIAFAVANEIEANSWNAARATRSVAMELATVDPGETLSGFVFYECPAGTTCWTDSYSNLKFRIARLPRSGGGPLDYSLAMTINIGESP